MSRIHETLVRFLSERVASRFATGGWKVVEPRSLTEEELDAIWNAYVSTYRKIGLTAKTIAEMVSDYDVWEVFYDGSGTIRAFSVAKRTPFGIKSGLVGSDGSPEGKTAVKAYLSTVYKRPARYSEVSHAVEHIALAAGSPVVCANNVSPVLKKPIEPQDDGLHYKRSLANVGTVTKIMVGNPRGVPTTSATNPTCEITTASREAPMRFSSDEPCDLAAHYACLIDLEG